MKRNREAENTWDSIRARYRDYQTIARPRRAAWRPYSTSTQGGSGMDKTIALAAGIGTGLLLLVLAGVAFWAAAQWGAAARDGAVVGYTVTGICLLVAALGALLGTANHIFRVLNPNRPRAVQH